MAKAFMRQIRAPTRKLDINEIAKEEIGRTLDNKIKPTLVKSHERIVRSWKSDIGFAARKVLRTDSISVYVFPTGPDKKIWTYVDRGTRPHEMPAISGKLMVFRAGGKYIPKTMAKPARTVSGGGRTTGGTKVFTTKRRAFIHPGSEGREFSEQIAKDILPEFRKEMENAFRRAVRKINRR